MSLTSAFALVSFLSFTVLGLVLVTGTNDLLRLQGIDDATETAEITTELAVRQNLDRDVGLAGALSPAQVRAVDSAIAAARPSVRHVRIWTVDGTPVYSSLGIVDREPRPASAEFAKASEGVTAGRVDSAAAAEAGRDDVVTVYVPLRAGSEVVAVSQVTLPYQGTQDRIERASIMIGLMVAVGLIVVWLIQYRFMHRASLRLRTQSEENAQLALHDPLTGLPNRRLLSERLERAALLSERTGSRVALMMLDVDRFKEVNDTLGHDNGDTLLRQVADRLRGAVRDMDTVARLGGDEFAVLLPSVARVEDAELLGRRVLDVFAEPFEIDGLALHVDSSIGLAIIPDHADDVSTLMQHADVAMYVAKSTHTGLATYSPQDDAHNAARLVMLGDLRRALDSPDELEVFYQPKVSLRSGEVVGLEALLRWHHPTQGTIEPHEFIPLAERTGLIQPLTRRVLDLVVHQIAEWDREGREVPVAVNLSARNLNEPRLVDYIADLLDRNHVHPVLLELEVTEDAMLEDPEVAREMLTRLANLGIQIAVDDFGVGYTSMAQLESLPLRSLKIDQSFADRMIDDPGGAVLIKAVIDLAHESGLLVIAEGVEQESTLAELRRLGCDVAQGFHWSPAVPAAEVHDVLDRICVARGRDSVGGTV
jgi:diguanylate cyclase (GGDEF)-like protein